MNSTYIVYFCTILIPKPDQDQIVATRVTSSTFLAVEDWAFENVPEGYELTEIQKLYGPQVELQGPVDIVLDGATVLASTEDLGDGVTKIKLFPNS